MRVKSQKFTEFINSTNTVNYKDFNVIIKNFNEAVRLFKKFEDIYRAGDTELATVKLRVAANTLYQSGEWALKNYLDRRYRELFEEGEISLENKVIAIDTLSKKDCNLYFLLEEMKLKAKPTIYESNLMCNEILNSASDVNNKTKHIAKTPDPNKFKIVLGEIRKLIRVYIDSEAKLSVLDDTIYGEKNVWYEIVEECNGFSEEYTYILITGVIPELNFDGLFSIKWDLVFDMDPETDVNGLGKKFINYYGVNPWIRSLSNVDARKKFDVSNISHWIMANGNADDSSTITDGRYWKSRYGKNLEAMLEKFYSSYTKPAKVFIYPFGDERNLEKVVDSFNTIYCDGDDIEFFVLSADSEYARIDFDNFKKMPLKFEEFCDNLMLSQEGVRYKKDRFEIKVPHSSGILKKLENSFYYELQDSFDVMYSEMETQQYEDITKTSRVYFYRGEEKISWYGLKEHFDVTRREQRDIISDIISDMDERGRLLKKVCYEAGMGGTTLLRRIAWELKEKYPTLIITRLNEQSTKNIQKIYSVTLMPILIFADSNMVDIDDIQKLHYELKTMGFAFLICYFERKIKNNNLNTGAIYTVIKSFSDIETREMKDRLLPYCIDENAKESLDSICQSQISSEERSPFIMSMYTFDKDFKGIKSYIEKFLRNINNHGRKMLFALSISDYGNANMDMQYFVDLFEDENIEEFLCSENVGIKELIKIEKVNGKSYLKIKYHLFAEEILCQLSNGSEAVNISFSELVDYIIEFIEDSRKNCYTYNSDVVEVLRTLFITRIADSDAEKPSFSPLITKLKEESKAYLNDSYDTSNDAIVRIFNKLVEVYPEEPHFTAHLARYYFYIEQNYDRGFLNIDKAIELSRDVLDKVDPLLYHMKAMGCSSKISNYYIKKIYINHQNGDKDEVDFLLEAIEENAIKAFEYFELVRNSNIGVAGHISDITLCTQIATMGKNMLEESENFDYKIVAKENEWIIKYIDRANMLLEECKKIATDNYDDVIDDMEIRLRQLVSNIDQTVSLWEDYLITANGSQKNSARRMLARAYQKKNNNGLNKEDIQINLRKVISLMEDNIADNENQAGNIRIWFDSIMKLESENQESIIMESIIKLNKWITLTDDVEAHYYRFVLKFIQAKNGSTLAEKDLPKLLRELKNKSINMYNRTTPQHWLSATGEGLQALVPNVRKRKNAVAEEEMADSLQHIVGRISNNYVNNSHAYISYRGVEVYFNPSATKGEIDKSKINQRVKFGIGFSLDGPRAYNSSIRLLGVEEETGKLRELSYGIIVKCEVIKNTPYFVKVKVIGYNNFASIHINEFCEPYSGEKRPLIGSIFDAKVLNRKFDNKTQQELWLLSMNCDSDEESVSETAFGKLLKNINL